MGKVAATIRVMPESPEVDLEALKQKIRETVEASDMKVVPIAFGLKAIDVVVLLPKDAEGGTSPIEEKLKSIEGVQSAETTSVTLV